ncbi:TM2 domain-containing protein [Mycoplasmatota bacterium]|nr:TM2 domain-containing protein [Mycoplasmatota bacterium]
MINISSEPKKKEETNDEKTKNNSKKSKKAKKDEFVIGKNKVIAILLALFLGRYGMHKFYLGKPALGFVYLIFSRYQIIMFFSICDAFIYLFTDNETWLKEYGYKKLDDKK